MPKHLAHSFEESVFKFEVKKFEDEVEKWLEEAREESKLTEHWFSKLGFLFMHHKELRMDQFVNMFSTHFKSLTEILKNYKT